MKKFTTKTIRDYIMGNDIEDFTLEELEDNEEFMKKVINYTNDEKMFYMCSERLQKNFEFIIFILYKFQHKLEFICALADSFLSNKEKSSKEDRYEIAIIMCELLGNRKDDISMKYHLIASMSFLWEMELVKECKKKSPKGNEQFGAGSIFVISNDDNSDVMLHYFAKRFILYILDFYDIDFEEVLHKRFKTPEELQEQKRNTLLTDFLSQYDNALANYAKAHLDILDILKEQINYAISNWKNYNNKKERDTYFLLLEKVHLYMIDNYDCPFLEDELLYSIGYELGILDKLRKYDYTDEDYFKGETIEKEKMGFNERRHYFAVKKLMESILNGTYQEKDEYDIPKEPAKSKVIQIFPATQKKG